MKYYFDTFSTSLGDFSVALNQEGAVVAAAFGGVTELRGRREMHELVRDPAHAATVRDQVRQFLKGRRRHFTLKLAPQGTAFQQSVWRALQCIPFGETRSYSELATELGHPGAARAVGRANSTNPLCVLVPCHRVIGANGSLTGYAFGVEIKSRLLEMEAKHSAPPTGHREARETNLPPCREASLAEA